MRDFQTSGFLSEFAEQLHGLSFTEDKERREESPPWQNCCFFIFTVKFGSDIQSIQVLSTPPRLSLHIHYVWLQLHHLLLQFIHLGLDTHTGVFSLFKVHVNASYRCTNTLNPTWPQLTAVCSISLHTPSSFSDARRCRNTNISQSRV